MTPDEFVGALKREVAAAAVDSVRQVLRRPSGRRPDPALVKLSQHYNQMELEDQEFIGKVSDLVAQHVVFGVLAVLDGVRPIEPLGPKGELELYYRNGDERVRLNAPDGENSMTFLTLLSVALRGDPRLGNSGALRIYVRL